MAPAQKLILGLKVPKVHLMKILLLPCEKGCFSASYSIHVAATKYCTRKIIDHEKRSYQKWPCFLLFFWQFPVVTDIQYTYQNKAFFKVYNFCIYITINIWQHETVFSLCLQNQGSSLFLARISLEPYKFLSCVLF